MRRRRCFGVALLLQASIGFAATTVTPGPCGNSAPVFSVVADAHHIIALTESLPEGSYGAPTFTISGNTIDVHRTVAPASASQACVTDSVDLGTLAAGAYHLVWTDVMPVARTSTFDFAVGSNVAVGTTGFLQPADFQALPPLTPTSPVRIVTNYCAMNTKVAAGVASVHGSSIDIDESIVDGSPLQCEQLYDLGLLAVGKYTATLRQTVVGAGGSTQTYTQHFIVQQPSPTASCDPANVSILSDHQSDADGGRHRASALRSAIRRPCTAARNTGGGEGRNRRVPADHRLSNSERYRRPDDTALVPRRGPRPRSACSRDIPIGVGVWRERSRDGAGRRVHVVGNVDAVLHDTAVLDVSVACVVNVPHDAVVEPAGVPAAQCADESDGERKRDQRQ